MSWFGATAVHFHLYVLDIYISRVDCMADLEKSRNFLQGALEKSEKMCEK